MRKPLKITVIAISVVVGLLLLLSAVAGPLVTRFINHNGKALCNRELHVSHTRVLLLTGHVTFVDFAVKEENSADNFATFDKLRVRCSLPHLLKKTVLLRKVHLNNLKTNIIKSENGFNFSDIVDFFTTGNSDETPSKWTVDLRKIKISESNVIFLDKTIANRVEINNINVSVPRLLFSDDDSDINIAMDFANGGNMKSRLLYNVENKNYDLDLKINDFQVKTVAPYLKKLLNFDKLNGAFSCDLSAKGSVSDLENILVNGSLSLNNASVFLADNEKLCNFDKIYAKIGRIDLKNRDFDIESVKIENPEVCYTIFENGNSFSQLLNSENVENSDTSSGNSLKFSIKKVELHNGNLLFVDKSMKNKMQYSFSKIDANVENFSNATPAIVKLTANHGNSGTFEFDGILNPTNFSDAKFNVSIKNVELKDFEPYFVNFTAYPVENGIVSFKSTNVIRNNWLESQNNLDAYKPIFGKKDASVKAEYNIPMRVAMFFLTDRKGHAQIELPVKGNIDSPEFSFRKLIWKAFVNFIVKVAASPIDFISEASKKKVPDPMIFPLDKSAELSTEQVFKLKELSELLKENENLSITIYSSEIDYDYAQNCDNQQVTDKYTDLVKRQLEKNGVSGERILKSDEKKAKSKLKNSLTLSYELNLVE